MRAFFPILLSNDFPKVTVASDFLKVFDFIAPLVKHYMMSLAQRNKVAV
jgi:hypothetical protein